MSVKDTLLAVSGLLGGNSGGGGGGGEAVLVNKTVSANGTYLPSADSADGYKKVVVNVPTPTPTLVTKAVTENGTYAAAADNADGYSSVTVNVQGSGGDPYEVARSILNNTITEYIDPEITTIKNGAFQYCTTLTTLKVHNLTQVGQQAFQGTTSLGNVAFPRLTTFSPASGQYFLASTSAPVIDFGRYLGTGIGNYIMENATTTTLVLRSTVAVPLRHIASLPKPFQNNETGGTLYVPSTLISSYQAATNWSTVLGYTNNQIKAIEGSIYETQYADGTPVGS